MESSSVTFYKSHLEDQRYMKTHTITLCGSMRKNLDLFNQVINTAKKYKLEVLSPQSWKKISEIDGFVRTDNDPQLCDIDLESYHLRKVYDGELVFVLNPQGRVGTTSFSEILFANFFKKPILFLEQPNNEQEKLVKDIADNSAYQKYINMHSGIEEKIRELRRVLFDINRQKEYGEEKLQIIEKTEHLIRPL